MDIYMPAAAYIAQQRRRATDALILWLATTGQLAPGAYAPNHDAPDRQQVTGTDSATDAPT